MAVIHLPNIHPLPGQGDGTAFLINPFILEGKLNKKTHDSHKTSTAMSASLEEALA